MKVGVYFNDKYFSDDNRLIEKICKEFSDCSCRVVVDASDLQGLEVLFVLGGDGTILGLAAECAKSGVKIIGVNYGHMGWRSLNRKRPTKLLRLSKAENILFKSVVCLKLTVAAVHITR